MTYKLDDALLYSVESRVFISDGNLFRTAQTPLDLGDVEILGMSPSVLFVGLETLTQEITIMAFNLRDLSVQIRDQIDDAVDGVTVSEIDVKSMTEVDITVDIDPSTKLGSIKAVLEIGGDESTSDRFQTFTQDFIGIKVPNSLSFDALAGDDTDPGAASGDGVHPIQPDTSHNLTYTGYGFYHATTSIFGTAGLAAHQPGVGASPAGFIGGSYSASPSAIAQGDEVPCLIDILGGASADDSMASVNANIVVNSVSIQGREASHRRQVIASISLDNQPETADMLLPEGKRPAKLRAQAWDGTDAYRVAEQSEAAFQVALRPIAAGSASMSVDGAVDDDVAVPASIDDVAAYSGPELVAGTGSGTLSISVADSNGNACLGTLLNHGITVRHDVFTARKFSMTQNSLQIAANGKDISQDFTIPYNSPTGIYNILIDGDQNGSGEVNVGQVLLEAADIVVSDEVFQIVSVTPGEFDAAENGMQEVDEKATWSLTLADSPANLPGPDEGTFLCAYLKKGSFRYDFVDAECTVDSDNTATLVLDLRSSAMAAHLDGADFNYETHLGNFTLHLEVYDRGDVDATGFADDSDMFAKPAEGASALSSGSFDGVLITSPKPLAVPKTQLTMDDGQPAEYHGVTRPVTERWIQAGTANAIGAARTLKLAVINAASPSAAPGSDDPGGLDLHQTYVQIVRTSDGVVVGDSRNGRPDLAGNHGDGSDLFFISNLSLTDRIGGSYGAGGSYTNGLNSDGSTGSDQHGLITDIEFDIQAVHQVGQDTGEMSVGVEVSLDADLEATTPAYQIEVVTRAVDMGASPAESALTFAGEAGFYVFPRQVSQLSLANAVLEVAPPGTTLQQVLAATADWGLFPTTTSEGGGDETLTQALAANYRDPAVDGPFANTFIGSGGNWDLEWGSDGLIMGFHGQSSFGSTLSVSVQDHDEGGQTVTFANPAVDWPAAQDPETGMPVMVGTAEDGLKALIMILTPSLSEGGGPTDDEIVNNINASGYYHNVATSQVLRTEFSDFTRPNIFGSDDNSLNFALVYILTSQIL